MCFSIFSLNRFWKYSMRIHVFPTVYLHCWDRKVSKCSMGSPSAYVFKRKTPLLPAISALNEKAESSVGDFGKPPTSFTTDLLTTPQDPQNIVLPARFLTG